MILLNMSFSATAIVILISVMRKLFLNKIPKIFFYLFWIVPLFRLLFPVNIPGIWNLGGTLNSLVSQVFFDNITIAEKLNSTQDTSLLPGVDMNTYETSGIFIVWLIFIPKMGKGIA
jgi:beta-lactamase regulating signal transducer with metallopeptidase domain